MGVVRFEIRARNWASANKARKLLHVKSANEVLRELQASNLCMACVRDQLNSLKCLYNDRKLPHLVTASCGFLDYFQGLNTASLFPNDSIGRSWRSPIEEIFVELPDCSIKHFRHSPKQCMLTQRSVMYDDLPTPSTFLTGSFDSFCCASKSPPNSRVVMAAIHQAQLGRTRPPTNNSCSVMKANGVRTQHSSRDSSTPLAANHLFHSRSTPICQHSPFVWLMSRLATLCNGRWVRQAPHLHVIIQTLGVNEILC